VKYWEIIADNLSKAGWSWGCVSAVTSEGRIIWVADAHRGDGKRFVVRGARQSAPPDHSCGYMRQRNALIPQAEKIATSIVSRREDK